MDWGLLVGVLGVPASVALTMGATSRGEFHFIRGCFIAVACGTIGAHLWWQWTNEAPLTGWRVAIAGLVGAITVAGLVLALDWVKRKETAAIPDAQPISDRGVYAPAHPIPRISVDCSKQILPKMIAANETVDVLWLFPTPLENGGGGVATQFNGSGQPWRWPDVSSSEGIFLSAYRCEVTNYGTDPVIDFRMVLDVKFYAAIPVFGQPEGTRGHGDLKLHRPWDIAIQKIDAGRENSYKFYIINNQRDLFVHILMPQTAALRPLGENQNIQVPLTVAQLGRDYPLLFGPNFTPEPPAEKAK